MKLSSHLLLPYHGFWSIDGLTKMDVLSIFDSARWLKEAARAGRTGRCLLGKNLAILRRAASDEGNSALHRAALNLGARVAHVPFDESLTPGGGELRNFSQMLGRLYDAIDCGTMAPALAGQIERDAGVPVFNGLDRDEHPASVLADLMTVCEHCAGPVSKTVISFFGDPHTLRGETFLRAATLVGFEVRSGEERLQAASDARLVVDATHPSQWSLQAPPEMIDEAERAANHRVVLQTILLNTLAAR